MVDLAIRAVAGSVIGGGHVMRCLALAEAWAAAGGRPAFLVSDIGTGLEDRLRAAGFSVIQLASAGEAGGAADLKATLATLAANGHPACWVCLDGYALGPEYQSAVRSAGHPLIVIDDTAHQPVYHTDVLLNQNIEAAGMSYVCAPEPIRLMGSAFALIRSEFIANTRTEREHRVRQPHILVTCGTGDSVNLTLKVFRDLDAARVSIAELVLVLGGLNPHFEEITEAVAVSRLAPVTRIVRNPPSICPFMTEADLAIAAAGSTSLELCYMGVPTLFIQAADNQIGIGSGLARRGAAIDLGHYAALTPGDIAKGVEGLSDPQRRAALSARARKVVDGMGRGRVVRTLRARSALVAALGDHVLRPAVASDMAPLLELANDPTVRARSLTTDPIPPTDHARWFSGRLESNGTRIFVLDIAGRVAGQIRYERLADHVAEVHFAVAPECRGRGAGTALLGATLWLAAVELGVSRLQALVLPDNVASARAFEKAGFRRVDDVNRKGWRCLSYELSTERELR